MNEAELLEKMNFDVEEIMSSEYESSFQFLVENESPKFYWYTFFLTILQRINHTDYAKLEIVSQMRLNDNSGAVRQRHIDKFEADYTPDRAIFWYTRESALLYSLLNRALRFQDINKIFTWRMTIKDLDNSLKSLSVPVNSGLSIVYRGSIMSVQEIRIFRENLGKLFVAQSFLSTSFRSDIACAFAESSFTKFDRPAVLFTIFVDFNNPNITARCISDQSGFRDEEECLFTLRSLFRIDSVESFDNIYHIQLTALGEDDPEYRRIIDPWEVAVGQKSFFHGRCEPLFNRFINQENSSFIAFQLLLDMMLRLDRTTFARDEMIEMCQVKYADRPLDLAKIQQFAQTYKEEDAIKWYTTDSFLYRLLHEAIRMEDIDCIFKMRYYIQDLHNQLAREQESYLQQLPSSTLVLTLYRGQRMLLHQLEEYRQNIGELIAMNSFLSTTNDSVAASFFAGLDSLDDPDREVSVIYEIEVDLSIAHSVPFASIAYKSIYKDEAEVLFSMAAVFQIDQVEKHGKLWVVNLTLINKEDEYWNELTAHLDR